VKKQIESATTFLMPKKNQLDGELCIRLLSLKIKTDLVLYLIRELKKNRELKKQQRTKAIRLIKYQLETYPFSFLR
jgi:hypothetical protein